MSALLKPVPPRPRPGKGVNNRDIHKWYLSHKAEIIAEVKVTSLDVAFARWNIPPSRWYAFRAEWGLAEPVGTGREQVPSPARGAPQSAQATRSATEMLNRLKQNPVLELNLGVQSMQITDVDLCLLENADFERLWMFLGDLVRRRTMARAAQLAKGLAPTSSRAPP